VARARARRPPLPHPAGLYHRGRSAHQAMGPPVGQGAPGQSTVAVATVNGPRCSSSQ
jgi:hypothetical protein